MCRSPRDFSKHEEKLTKRIPRDSLMKGKSSQGGNNLKKQKNRDSGMVKKKLEQSRRNLCVREKELEKSEELKESELQRAKTLYEEANDRLLKALKNKNFNEVTVAQGLLEVAKKKMDDVMEQSRQCSSKRSQLTKNKKRLLEGYSKHLSFKKKKSH